VNRRGRLVSSVRPLFPSYLFVLPKEGCDQITLQFLPGVRGLVRFGVEPAPVPCSVIEELLWRCAKGPIELQSEPLTNGIPVRVTQGPFSEFEGIFEHYLSGRERVAILLSVLGAATVRLVVPAAYAERSTRP
jgi:transcription antitermination factor NusG